MAATTNGTSYGTTNDNTSPRTVSTKSTSESMTPPPAKILKSVASSHSTNSKLSEEPPPKHSMKGIFLIMLGAFSFSVMFLLVKLMADMNTFTLVLYRSLVQIAISLASLIQRGENPLGPPDLEVRFYLVCRAIFGALAVCAWFFGIQLLPLPDAVTLQFTTPPFAAAFAVCMVGEHWKVMDMIGAVVCLTGVAFIAHPTWLFGGSAVAPVEDDDSTTSGWMKMLAVLVTTGGAAMAGIAYVCVRKIGDRADAVVMVLYYGALSVPMTMLGSGLLAGDWNVLGDFEHFTIKDYGLLILMGLGGYGGQWFTNLGLQIESAATATLATTTQIVWTYVFELMFLHEALDPWSMGGTALILGYMLVLAAIKMMQTNQHIITDATEEEQLGLLEQGDPGITEYQALHASLRNSDRDSYQNLQKALQQQQQQQDRDEETGQ